MLSVKCFFLYQLKLSCVFLLNSINMANYDTNWRLRHFILMDQIYYRQTIAWSNSWRRIHVGRGPGSQTQGLDSPTAVLPSALTPLLACKWSISVTGSPQGCSWSHRYIVTMCPALIFEVLHPPPTQLGSTETWCNL